MFFPASIYLEVKNHWQQKHDNRIPASSPIQGIRRFIVTPLRPAESGWNVLKGQIHKEDQRLYPGDLHDLWSKVVTHLYVTRTDNSDWWFSLHVSCLRYSKSELMRKSCRKPCACLTVSSWLLDRGKREKEREREDAVRSPSMYKLYAHCVSFKYWKRRQVTPSKDKHTESDFASEKIKRNR